MTTPMAYSALVIEDNAGDILLIQEAIKSAGVMCDLTTISDGAEAMDYVRKMDGTAGPDIVLLDLNLPKADGLEILHAIRQNPRLSDAPIIVLTSSHASFDKERVSALNVEQHFVKPGDLDEFMKLGNTIEKVLKDRPRRTSGDPRHGEALDGPDGSP